MIFEYPNSPIVVEWGSNFILKHIQASQTYHLTSIFPPQICAQQILAIILFHQPWYETFTHQNPRGLWLSDFSCVMSGKPGGWKAEGSRHCRWGCGSHCKQIFLGNFFCDQTAGNGWLPTGGRHSSPILKSYKICWWTLGRQGRNCSTAARIV